MSRLHAEATQSKSEQLGEFITSPHTLAAKVLEWREKGFHVLAPAIQISTFAPGYGVNPALVLLDPHVDDKGRGLDVYYDKNTMSGAERGPSKIGIGKLASAAGVSWISQESGRRDPLTIQHLWIYQMLGVYLAYDGTPQTIHGEKEIDYRDGSAQIGGWTPERWKARGTGTAHINGWSESRVLSARMNGAERAETGAMERAIRMGFGIKHAYTLEELKQPFVALRVCPIVDMTNETVRQMVTARALAGVAALYSGQPSRRALSEAPAPVIEFPSRRQEPVPVGASSTPAASQPATVSAAVDHPAPVSRAADSPAPTTSTPEAPDSTSAPSSGRLPEQATVIALVYTKDVPYGRQHAKHGQTFQKWFVVDHAGVEHVTIFEKVGKDAQECCQQRIPVVLEVEFNERYRESALKAVRRPASSTAATSPAPSAGGLKL